MKFTAEQTRRILCGVHGFDRLAREKKGTKRVMERLSCVQVDPIDAAGKNHDLTLFSRVEDYRPSYLRELLYEDRTLFEYYCKMLSILPMDSYPFFRTLMEKQDRKLSSFFHEQEEHIEYILDVMKDVPVSSLELKDMGANREHDWRTTKMCNRILRNLWLAGKIVISHRKGGRKYYTPAEKVLPNEVLERMTPDHEETKYKITEMIVRASRLVSPSKASAQWSSVGGVREVTDLLKMLEDDGKVFSLEVEGWKGDLFAHQEDRSFWEDPYDLDRPFVRFLAPLDPMLWNRELFSTIFEHEYVWEIYKKKEERIYGYYCLPVLFNGDYVAIIEPYYRKRDRVLEIKNHYILEEDIREEVFDDEFRRELERFMGFLGAETVKTDVT